MPRSTISWAGSWSMRSPSKWTSPAVGLSSPEIVRRTVVFPAPLLPMSVTSRPGVDRERHALHRLDPPVRHPHVADLEQGGHVSGRAQVGLDDPGIGLDLGRRALHQLRPLHQHRHPVAEVEDEAHVVLDDHHRDALVAHPADEVHGRRRLVGVHARGGFVEQEEAGVGGQGPGDLQPALVAVGQVLAQGVPVAGEADEGQQLGGPGLRLPLLPAEGGPPADGGEHPGPGAAVAADEDVLQGAHLGEQADVLERPGDAGLRHPGRVVGQLPAPVDDPARRRLQQPGEAVEERGLARPVGPDEAHDLALAPRRGRRRAPPPARRSAW